MVMICYEPRNFQRKTQAVIDSANVILEEYSKQGYTLTLRQLYYQFVSRDLIPNSDREYNKLGETITAARLAGEVSWLAIEDRNRSRLAWPVAEEEEIIGSLAGQLSLDLNEGQEFYVEVWVEKDALSNVVARGCAPTRTPYMACKGYLSASEAWRAGRRMKRAREHGQTPVVIHLGDHDPSGIDMTRDNTDRLTMFSEGEVIVERVALNRDQVDQYQPPENPAKLSDSRAPGYIAQHGYSSWELDALEPSVLVRIIQQAVSRYTDMERLQGQLDDESSRSELLQKLTDNWVSVRDFLEDL